MVKIPRVIYKLFTPIILCAIPATLLSIAKFKVKPPTIKNHTFPAVLSEHNKQLIISLTDKPDPVEEIMYVELLKRKELEWLRMELRRQTEESPAFEIMRKWLWALLGCFAVSITIIVIMSMCDLRYLQLL